jgi:hypothetical protein
MQNWNSLQILQAGHLLGSLIPMASEDINSGGEKSKTRQPSTLAVSQGTMQCMLGSSSSGAVMFLHTMYVS